MVPRRLWPRESRGTHYCVFEPDQRRKLIASYRTGHPREDEKTKALAAVKAIARGLFGGNSFPAGTPVITPEGSVAIEDLREGDFVLARHEVTGEMGAFPVTALMARQAPGVLRITLADAAGLPSELAVTAEHPLFVVGRGWTQADQIAAGDMVRDAELTELTITAVVLDATPVMVHNLEVAEAHTFFVGEAGVWGHNKGLGGNPSKGKKFHEITQIFRARGFTPCSTKRMADGRTRSEWESPKGTKFFLDDTGEYPGMGDHVDVWKACKRKKKRKPLQ